MNVEKLRKMAGSVRTGERSKHPLQLTLGSLVALLRPRASNFFQLCIAPFYFLVPELQDILPQIIHQLGPDNLENLKKLAEQFQKQAPAVGNGSAFSATEAPDDDDEVPDLVAGETFEAAAEEDHPHAS
ncbi:Nascent polypeptide-associated complex subunit beta [Sesamum angolense]|uniref:Nascent polypeptide-associated complex subunit beta n=1 Tax=Sesamum angolense TaxID=2727404 RepID=A0AAE1WID4_9LAMI|nr:Nascent polypeptide-associated complex subunit beta [Sesamum angolense]